MVINIHQCDDTHARKSLDFAVFEAQKIRYREDPSFSIKSNSEQSELVLRLEYVLISSHHGEINHNTFEGIGVIDSFTENIITATK